MSSQSNTRFDVGVSSPRPRVRRRPPIPVVVIIPSLEVGGAEMDLLRNLPRLDRARFSVTVYTFEQRGQLAPAMEAAGIPVHGPSRAPGPVRASHTGTESPTFRQQDAVPEAARPAGDLPSGSVAVAQEETGSATPESLNGGLRSLGARARARMRASLERYPRLRAMIRGSLLLVLKAVNAMALARQYGAVVLPMSAYLWRRNPAVVHCLIPNAYFFGTIATLLSGRRCVVMSRLSLNLYQAQYPSLGHIERKYLHRVVRVAVGNARIILRQLRDEGIPERKLFLLYNGIDAETFTPRPGGRAKARQALGLDADCFVMTVVANLHPYKGHADLLRALALAGDRMKPHWMLLVPGRDQQGQRLRYERLAAELGIEAKVQFLGPRDDISTLLAASDLHIHPSHQEALPNSIIEAMAAELAVIATRVGGIPELIEDGVNGLLIQPQRPEALSEAIVQLAQAPQLRDAMGQRSGRKVREGFTLQHSVERYQQLYALAARRRLDAAMAQ